MKSCNLTYLSEESPNTVHKYIQDNIYFAHYEKMFIAI